MTSGNHLIAGNWVTGNDTFTNTVLVGEARKFSVGKPEHIDAACVAADEAFASYGTSTDAERAKFLRAIADEIEHRADAITAIGIAETGLPAARLEGERGRTCGQMGMFADHIKKGEYLDKAHDETLPDRLPAARPDLKLIQRPMGPVAVFGASNFPLAFSTAGGDTASALAAGCPVVAKGHEAHPGTGEIIAEAIDAAIKLCGIHPGVFSFIHGGDFASGKALVEHPLIVAVGFTGSLRGGRALFDLCAQRADPIPFYGELGSVNPVFLLPAALEARAEEIGAGWAGSLTMGAGQFCTNPGVVIVKAGSDADTFMAAATDALSDVAPQTMLTDSICNAYWSGSDAIAGAPNVETLYQASKGAGRQASPRVYQVGAKDWMANKRLQEEVFGPIGVIVTCSDDTEMLAVARELHGQL
ncbi:MAG: aldehyde dehydrogenase (NADP(+)), partial [Rhizobiaceae bacterium]